MRRRGQGQGLGLRPGPGARAGPRPPRRLTGRECRGSNEAPPRMRWRGLARAIQQGRRLLGYRDAVRPLHRGGKISPEGQFPGSPRSRPHGPVSRAVGVGGLQLIFIFGGAEFLPPATRRRKGFLPGIYGFYGYEQLFHMRGRVIPRAGRLSTGSSTTRSTAWPTAMTGCRGVHPCGPQGGTGAGTWLSPRGGGAAAAAGWPDPPAPRWPGRGNHPDKFRCGPWIVRVRHGGGAGCPAGPGRAHPPEAA